MTCCLVEGFCLRCCNAVPGTHRHGHSLCRPLEHSDDITRSSFFSQRVKGVIEPRNNSLEDLVTASSMDAFKSRLNWGKDPFQLYLEIMWLTSYFGFVTKNGNTHYFNTSPAIVIKCWRVCSIDGCVVRVNLLFCSKKIGDITTNCSC